MRLNAIVAGVGMTPFGKHMDTGLKALGAEAVKAAIADAGIGHVQLVVDPITIGSIEWFGEVLVALDSD